MFEHTESPPHHWRPRHRRLATLTAARAISLVVLPLIFGFVSPVAGVPYFARRYDIACEHCHVLPPKLNSFGEQFLAGGYSHPSLTAGRTWPLAVWASGRAESRRLSGGDRETLDPFLNRVELISGGPLGKTRLSYFAEWRPVSQESRADGSLRDRSGRFEDLFVVAALPAALELTVGQFRPLAQIDVSRRLALSEPLVFAAALAGSGGGAARPRSLRAFAPSGRSPAARLAWRHALPYEWRLTSAATLAVPGELSMPLNGEAKVEASHELEWRPKGVFAEVFAQRGLATVGGHVFYDDGERYLAHLVTTGRRGAWFWAFAAGFDHSRGEDRARWSAEAEYIPARRWALGLRLEDRQNDGAEAAILPYAVWHFPFARSRFALTLEQRLQQDRNATTLEISYLF